MPPRCPFLRTSPVKYKKKKKKKVLFQPLKSNTNQSLTLQQSHKGTNISENPKILKIKIKISIDTEIEKAENFNNGSLHIHHGRRWIHPDGYMGSSYLHKPKSQFDPIFTSLNNSPTTTSFVVENQNKPIFLFFFNLRFLLCPLFLVPPKLLGLFLWRPQFQWQNGLGAPTTSARYCLALLALFPYGFRGKFQEFHSYALFFS